MRREVTPSLVTEAAYLGLYPAAAFRGDVLAAGDEHAWRYAAANATDTELVELLVGLGPQLLTVTPGGARRCEAYKRAATETDPEPILVGDIEFLPTVRAALALMPPIVRYAVLREAAFIGCGRSSRAFTSSSKCRDITGRERPQMVVMSPDVDELTLLHEGAHVFTSRVPSEMSQAVIAIGERNLRALAAAEGWLDQINSKEYISELLADSLALAWLYSPTPTPGVS